MMDDDRDFEEEGPKEGSRPVVKHVVKDLASAVKMRRVQAQADAKARQAEAKTELAKVKAEERKRQQELKAELQKMRLGMTARESASKHIAVFGPLYLMLLVAMFLAALGSDVISGEQIPVVSALLTLLVTMIGANLRSIVSEGNGDDEKPGKSKPK